tara:strand:+ start:3030 stop:4232 length:1203 start_codon:yes stop_codon:yes gene_type:complete
MVKFAHIADVHIGGWREPKLRELGYEAFKKAMQICKDKKVDFVLVAGDLFNTAMPGIDGMKIVVEEFKDLQEVGIPIYLIAGSHDYSPSGKTMLDVLEKAGLFVNVCKGVDVDGKLQLRFTVDEKTGAKITGVLGKRSGLDKSIYHDLLLESLENEEGYKIFMFHNLLTEFKTKELEKVDSSPLSLLPKKFNYYAGGHVHIVEQRDVESHGKIVYPGPLFPNSFDELEKLGFGGFFIVDNEKTERVELEMKKHLGFNISVDGLSVEQADQKIKETLEGKVFTDVIVTLRVYGTLSMGKPSDIKFKEMFEFMNSQGAFFIMKNTNKLESKEFETINVETGNVKEIEEKLIKEHLGQIAVDKDEQKLILGLMESLSKDKVEGERVTDYEERMKKEVERIIEL